MLLLVMMMVMAGRIGKHVVWKICFDAGLDNLVWKQVCTMGILRNQSVKVTMRGHHERYCETH